MIERSYDSGVKKTEYTIRAVTNIVSERISVNQDQEHESLSNNRILERFLRFVCSYYSTAFTLITLSEGLSSITQLKAKLLLKRSTLGGFFSVELCNDVPAITIVSTVQKSLILASASNNVFGQVSSFCEGSGFAQTFDLATMSALGEFVERSSFSTDKQMINLYSCKELSRKSYRFLHPDSFTQFKQLHTHDDDSVFGWVQGRLWGVNKKILLPAQSVFWDYEPSRIEHDELFITESNTNGCASHSVSNLSILSAWFELIERDGFLLHWYTKTPPSKIKIDCNVDNRILELLGDVSRYGFSCYFLKTQNEFNFPSVTCVLVDAHSQEIRPHVVFGGSTKRDWESAIYAALLEAIGGMHYQRKVFATINNKDSTDNSHHYRLYQWSDPKHFSKISWFLTGEGVSLQSLLLNGEFSIKESLKNINETLKAQGWNAYYVNRKHKLSLLHAVFCTKVIVPKMIGLQLHSKNSNNVAFMGERISGLSGFSLPDSCWITGSHPYP